MWRRTEFPLPLLPLRLREFLQRNLPVQTNRSRRRSLSRVRYRKLLQTTHDFQALAPLHLVPVSAFRFRLPPNVIADGGPSVQDGRSRQSESAAPWPPQGCRRIEFRKSPASLCAHAEKINWNPLPAAPTQSCPSTEGRKPS